MILRLNSESQPSEDEISLFSRHVNSLRQASLIEMPLIAGLFAKFELHSMAAKIYMYTAHSILASISTENRGGYQETSEDTLLTLLDLCIEINANLPDELARKLVSDILVLASISNFHGAAENAYHAFSLDVVLSLVQDFSLGSSETKILNRYQNSDSISSITEALYV